MTPDEITAERAKTHGDFFHVSAVAQDIKEVMRARAGWNDLPLWRREALDNIAEKIARVMCGDHSYADHWDDIAGYALLGRGE